MSYYLALAKKALAEIEKKEQLHAHTPNQKEVCWHCFGEKICSCASCGFHSSEWKWNKGKCVACKGAGYLIFSSVQ